MAGVFSESRGGGLRNLCLPDGAEREKTLQGLLLLGVLAVLVVAVLLPLAQVVWKSFSNADGRWVALDNYKAYFASPALWTSVRNSLFISCLTTLLVIPAAFAYAYGLTRTLLRGKGVLFGLALVPLLAPTLLNGLVLVYLFGRQGLVTRGVFGLFPGLDIGLYGPVGVILAEVVYTFPQAVLILATSLRLSDGQLAAAARSMNVRAPGNRPAAATSWPCAKASAAPCFMLPARSAL